MEIRARYILIGLFTLAVIAAGFGFVYWLESSGGFGKRTTYLIRFQNSVSGLLPGSAVLFNGIRVGEVTRLNLLPDNPREVQATISVDAETPIRSDTEASLDFQGLTGAPVVTLTGGSSSAPLRTSGQVPLLVADKTAGQTMSNAARQVLGRIDRILEENEGSLHSMLTSLSTFSDALGKNSGRVETILAGLERMTGGAGGIGGPAYDLTALQKLPIPVKRLPKQLGIAEPNAPMIYDTEKLLIQNEKGELSSSVNTKWTDTLPKLLQARIIQSFENNESLGQVIRYVEGLTPDWQLMTDIRRFQIVTTPEPMAEVELGAKVVSNDGHIIAARIFKASELAKKPDGAEAASALNSALNKVLSDLIVWTVGAVEKGEEINNAESSEQRKPLEKTR